MPVWVTRITLPVAVLLASVLLHLGLFGVMVFAERRELASSQTQTIDVELVRADEIPPEPEKPEADKPEPEKLKIPEPEIPKPDVPKPDTKANASPPPELASAPAPSPAAPAAPSGTEPQPDSAETKSDATEPPAKPALSSGGPAGEGMSKLTPEEIAALRAQVQKCWQLPVGMPGVLGLEVVIRVAFGPKGQVMGEPVLLQAPASERGPLLVGIAMRALSECGPYRMPSAKYAAGRASICASSLPA